MSELERLNQALNLAGRKIGYSKKSEIAAFLGYRGPYYSGVINGKEKLSDEFLKRISDLLGINPDWVRTGEGHIMKEQSFSVHDEIVEPQNGQTVPYFLYKELQNRYEAVVRENESLRIRLSEYESQGKKKAANL